MKFQEHRVITRPPKYSAIKLGLLQIKNTRYSGSNAPIFMHFVQEFGELCSFSFCYFYFGIWRRVTLYEKDNNKVSKIFVQKMGLLWKLQPHTHWPKMGLLSDSTRPYLNMHGQWSLPRTYWRPSGLKPWLMHVRVAQKTVSIFLDFDLITL